jgi:hypothetical protein
VYPLLHETESAATLREENRRLRAQSSSLALASEIQARVHRVFGVSLEIEPVRWG